MQYRHCATIASEPEIGLLADRNRIRKFMPIIRAQRN
jgi:hypothetical protein